MELKSKVSREDGIILDGQSTTDQTELAFPVDSECNPVEEEGLLEGSARSLVAKHVELLVAAFRPASSPEDLLVEAPAVEHL